MTTPVEKNSEHFQGIVLMIMVSIIWASMPVAIAEVITTVSPFVQIAARFTIGAVVFAPFARNLNRDLVVDGTILGLLMFAAFVTQTIALETLAANQASFTLGLVVIFITLFEVVFYRRLSLMAILAGAFSFTGIGIMSWQDGPPPIGAIWMLISALLVSAIVLLLDIFAPRHPPLPLTVIQLWVIAVLSWLLVAPQLIGHIEVISTNLMNPKTLIPIFYLGIVGTGIVTWLETTAMSKITAFESGIVQTIEPVLGALFAFFLLGQTFTMRGYVGAVMVLMGMMIALNQRKADALSDRPPSLEEAV